MGRWLDLPRRMLATMRQAERNTGRTRRRREPPTRPVDAGVRIEYTPHLDGDPDPGEVVWTWVPFEEDPTLGKDRPVVIIGRHGSRLSGVALTSKHKPHTIEVGTGPWDSQGRPSFAKVDRLLDIEPAAGPPGGRRAQPAPLRPRDRGGGPAARRRPDVT